MSKSFDDMVDAINGIASSINSIDSTKSISFEVDDYNMLAWIGENLHEISNTLKKIEAKM